MMGLDSIWNSEGDYLTKRTDKFEARSTGCSCCSMELDTESEVREHTIESLVEILTASKYFGWNFTKMIQEAKKNEKFKKLKDGCGKK